jgi:hypothetical protein
VPDGPTRPGGDGVDRPPAGPVTTVPVPTTAGPTGPAPAAPGPAGPAPAAPPSAAPAAPVTAPPSTVGPDPAPTPGRDPLHGLPGWLSRTAVDPTRGPLGVLARAAVHHPVPVGLILTVVGFLLAQTLVDRRNPRLLAAPLDGADDTLRFE